MRRFCIAIIIISLAQKQFEKLHIVIFKDYASFTGEKMANFIFHWGVSETPKLLFCANFLGSYI